MYHSAVPTSYFSIRYIPLHHQALHHLCTSMVQTPDHLRIITTVNFFFLSSLPAVEENPVLIWSNLWLGRKRKAWNTVWFQLWDTTVEFTEVF